MAPTLNRRTFLTASAGALGAAWLATSQRRTRAEVPARKPNLVFVFADQWRAQAAGYAGDPNARTPNLDRLARESVNFDNAVSCCPVCSPYRASLMTGRYPLTHGVFLNDVCLSTDAVSLAQAYSAAGYDTAYIGKWHLDGHGRGAFIPRERRQGFGFWKVLECTHDYNRSAYYGDEPAKLFWEGYDAVAQTREAQRYIRDHAKSKPFALVLSWGPPHDPYLTAPTKYRAMFKPESLTLRPNVPAETAAQTRTNAAGYYAHCAALDDCIGDLLATLKECGLQDDTVFVFTSDHGDMLGSQGQTHKQRPWDESVRVPLLVRYPAALGTQGKTLDVPINSPDLMPTVLGLCGVAIPKTVEGLDLSGLARGKGGPEVEAALIMCVQPFGQWTRAGGGKENRGVRTRRYTFVRDLGGPWLLYDNEKDPYQMTNLVNRPEHAAIQKELDGLLAKKLEATRDEFLPGPKYLEKWGYKVDPTGSVPYTP
jgi:arylsulfatase A-like enzyme